MSFFITFEGIEGCGKTTQIRRLAASLKAQGLDVLCTREPGGCPVADAVRNILLHPDNGNLVPRAELLLYAAARAQHVEEVIRPALDAGRIVLCDRYTDATLAYQGFGRRLDRQLIQNLNTLATEGVLPHLTLLLDMPAETGLARARRRNEVQTLDSEGRFEAESLDFHRRIRHGYLQLAEEEKDRFRIIPATGSLQEVTEIITGTVQGYLHNMGLL